MISLCVVKLASHRDLRSVNISQFIYGFFFYSKLPNGCLRVERELAMYIYLDMCVNFQIYLCSF